MKATPVVAAVLSLVPTVVNAQPATPATSGNLAIERSASGTPGFSTSQRAWSSVAFGATGGVAPRTGYAGPEGSSTPEAAGTPWTLELPAASPAEMTRNAASLSVTSQARLWLPRVESPKARKSRIDWLGLLSEQVRVDAIMHMYRLTEPKTHREVYHRQYLEGYVSGVKGYFTGPARWEDGDPFYGNNFNHPLMGAVYAHTYLNHDRSCKGVSYGDHGFWGCIGRAAAYSAVASVNWEWNPVMSETAIGHVGKFYTCANGRCAGEGGWSDFVMTPLGGLGMSIAGDIARAKLWPTLDRHLSGNLPARILKVALKVATDPASFAHAAFNMDFRNVMASRPYTGRR